MAPGLRFRAGSLTRSLVATAVLRLVAEARLSLSDGRRQLGVMGNVLPAPDPVYEGFRALGVRLLSGERP